MKNIIRNSFQKGIVTRKIGVLKGSLLPQEYEALGRELGRVIAGKFSRSFHIREVDTGSCNACESEILTATNPIYDIQRFGVDFVASPRHADALLVTGPVSRNMEHALKRTYQAMPGPKFVLTFGDCALNGGIFKDSYYTLPGVRSIIPVDAHIPGCPPAPADLVKILYALLNPA